MINIIFYIFSKKKNFIDFMKCKIVKSNYINELFIMRILFFCKNFDREFSTHTQGGMCGNFYNPPRFSKIYKF